jgi:hypothetical protein
LLNKLLLHVFTPVIQQVQEALVEGNPGLPTGSLLKLASISPDDWNIAGPQPVGIRFYFKLAGGMGQQFVQHFFDAAALAGA